MGLTEADSLQERVAHLFFFLIVQGLIKSSNHFILGPLFLLL